ncbi:MAG: isoprenylcysteine carboxylmethyltransferase family protein [Bryobacteraceae bacterium]
MTLRFPKPYADRVARLRVPGGFVLVAAFAWFSHPDARSLAAGLPVSLLGLWLRGWAAGHLAKNKDLATSGPYRYLRNPLYVGTLLVAAGLAIASLSVWLGALFAVVFLGIYLPVIQLEEEHLRTLFPEYVEYSRRVPALIPGRPIPGTGQSFRWPLYVRNQEYQAALGFLAGVVVLAWKALR